MTRARAADDFATIRERLEELRRERGASAPPGPGGRDEGAPVDRGLGRIDQRYKDRSEGAPPPWVPTIFFS
jgi:hypothetical protein